MKTKTKFIFLIIPLILLLLAFKLMQSFELRAYYQDIVEISDAIQTSKLEFASERSFGNDRFDIYSFSLTSEGSKYFSDIDEHFTRGYTGMINMLESELSHNTTLLKSVKEITIQNPSKYMYVKKDGTTKLYIYAPVLNKGYCLILTI